MAHVDNLRRHFPALRRVVYLNTGSCGALPEETVEAMREALTAQLHEGRRGNSYWDTLLEMRQRVRAELAHLFHVDERSFVLTTSTTEALNIALWGLPLTHGDELFITDVEHPGAVLPVSIQRQRRGVNVRLLDGSLPSDELCAQFERRISPRTRVLVCSHVSYATGRRLPVERLTEIAHRHGVWVVVDGAQGAGAEAFDLAAANIDLYAFPGHKWLCGPEGTGALYVHPRLLDQLAPTFIGSASLRSGDAYTVDAHYLPAADARRYEHTLGDVISWLGWWQSLHFLRVTAGWDYVFSRTHGLSGQLMDALLDKSGLRIVTPRDQRVGLVHFTIDGVDANQVVREARARDVDIRAISERRLVRVSTAFYNSEDDIARLIHVIDAVLG
jgi:L-cysteine/cystine lyase